MPKSQDNLILADFQRIGRRIKQKTLFDSAGSLFETGVFIKNGTSTFFLDSVYVAENN